MPHPWHDRGRTNRSRLPTTQGATIKFNIFATSSEIAMNMLRMWQCARLLSKPKQGPM